MSKKDIFTPMGLVLSIVLVIGAAAMGKAGLGIFYDFPSIIIVVFGSFASVMITFSMEDIKAMPKAIKYSMSMNSISKIEFIQTLKLLSKKARKDGLLSIESDIEQNIQDQFLKKGLRLAIDGVEANTIREILEIEISSIETTNARNSKVFKIWGSLAPAFGMIGTLIGLIQMLADLGNSDEIASGMAVALITTFYGSFLANVVLNPIGFNIDSKNSAEVYIREMMIEGILSLQSGESSAIIEEKLTSYLTEDEKKQYYATVNENPEGDTANVA